MVQFHLLEAAPTRPTRRDHLLHDHLLRDHDILVVTTYREYVPGVEDIRVVAAFTINFSYV